jgi:hypothetical protein
MITNIQVGTHQKFHKAFISWIDAGAPSQCVVRIGITSHGELLFPAVAVVNDVLHFLG